MLCVGAAPSALIGALPRTTTEAPAVTARRTANILDRNEYLRWVWCGVCGVCLCLCLCEVFSLTHSLLTLTDSFTRTLLQSPSFQQ
eukprot:m.251735 g.251735  ORF g.251735 m.251735 type:complete len:86 (+) comp26506_c3_seq28:1207-1464(+)